MLSKGVGMKQCKKCGKTKPIGEFCKAQDCKDGHSNRCVDCAKKYARDWYLAHSDTVKARSKEYFHSHRDAQIRNRREYYQAHREDASYRTKAYYEKNKDRILEYSKEYSRTHPDCVKKAQDNFNARHPDRVKTWKENWHRAHLQEAVLYEHARRTRKMNNGGSHTNLQWNELVERYGGRCLCCGKTGTTLTRDHIVPVRLGGSNSIENIQPLCKSCNSKKHTKTIDYRSKWEAVL